MSQFVNIPTSEWRKLCNEIAFIKEGLKAMALATGSTEWISEPVAMEMLGWKDKRTMRKKALENHINFTCAGGRNYKYLHKDIKKFLVQNSTL